VRPDDSIVMIAWHANPFRGDKFEDAWRPAAAAAIDYGASYWAFLRSKDDPLDFVQIAAFESKFHFDRYWLSEEISEARAEAMSLFQVPVLPLWLRAVDAGEIAYDAPAEATAE
jgi:hypothetical protein